MKYKEVKKHYRSGKLMFHHMIDETGNGYGEWRYYHMNGQLYWHNFSRDDYDYGEVKKFNSDGTLFHHYLMDDKCNELATVVRGGHPSTHSEEQLIQIAKEHNLPLLSELPKTEAEVTLWNLKHPDLPCLPIGTE